MGIGLSEFHWHFWFDLLRDHQLFRWELVYITLKQKYGFVWKYDTSKSNGLLQFSNWTTQFFDIFWYTPFSDITIYMYICIHIYIYICIHTQITYIHTYIYIYMHKYITTHYITLHYVTLHYVTLRYITYIHINPWCHYGVNTGWTP